MALGGEIASMFVRIRPNLTGFEADVTTGVKTALTESEVEIKSFAAASAAAASRVAGINVEVADSYKAIGAAAASSTAGITEARAAAVSFGEQVAAVAQANVAQAAENRTANLALAESYRVIGAAARTGSNEAVVAMKLAAGDRIVAVFPGW